MQKIRIPTTQYGFIEIESDCTPSEAIDLHNLLLVEYNQSIGVKTPTKEWNRILDKYLSENQITSDDWVSLGGGQKYIINEIKKSTKRIITKE